MDDEDYLLDAPVSVGDGFSFVGGKYSNEEGPAEKWFAQGKMVNACAVKEKSKKAQDPIFGLAMGGFVLKREMIRDHPFCLSMVFHLSPTRIEK